MSNINGNNNQIYFIYQNEANYILVTLHTWQIFTTLYATNPRSHFYLIMYSPVERNL